MSKTVGEVRMGITIIPGNNDRVQNLKEKAAHFINDVQKLTEYHEPDHQPSNAKLIAIQVAQDAIVTAGLLAANAATTE